MAAQSEYDKNSINKFKRNILVIVQGILRDMKVYVMG